MASPPPPSDAAGLTSSSPLPDLHPSSSSSTAAAPAVLTPRKDLSLPTSAAAAGSSSSKRSSFVDSSRNYPSSPRTTRPQPFSSQALAELLMHPSGKTNGGELRFKGRDWRAIQVHEIIDPAETRFVELDTSIEDTTKLLIRSGAPNVVLMRASRHTKTAIGIFDFSDLNAYLLLVLGLSQPDDRAAQLAERARSGAAIPLSDLSHHLGPREEPAFLAHTASLLQAMEVLGGGLHRIVITREGTSEAVGVLSQLRLVRFFWENHQNFAATEGLYSRTLRDSGLGTKQVLSINGDKPLSEALKLMHDEGITSLPVIDQQRNVVGNISHVDVRLLTDTASIPLLSSSCIHFISVILSDRGMFDGQDSYPVFHVTPFSTLAHTVAKLCATRSHRMWIVDSPSPSGSVPPSPSLHGSHPAPPFGQQTTSQSHARHGSISHEPTLGPPYTSTHPGVSVSAAQLPGAGMSGRLSGVVSLTDVLNLLARVSGLSPRDPEEVRRRRRRSSSSSSRPNLDGLQGSADLMRSSGELGRSTSISSVSSSRR